MTSPRKIILKNKQSPGDILMLTAALRDLHRAYPDRFLTDVRTSCGDLWQNNPYLTPIKEDEPDTTIIECRYPLIHYSNQWPYHFLHGFTHFLNRELKLAIRPTEINGDIHLSDSELDSPSITETMLGRRIPYWVIVAGGKWDYTIKWWKHERFQEVVNNLYGKVLFVQVGKLDHYHPPLRNVLDMRGQTTLRELLLLIHHSQGVLCPVTGVMHMAAAVPRRPGENRLRPCVVVAGGREPPHWESYPGHQFMHTVGMLPCCATGGCWKARTQPLGDGDERDKEEYLCKSLVDSNLPKCMDMISSADVTSKIDLYFKGGVVQYLSDSDFKHLKRCTNERLNYEN